MAQALPVQEIDLEQAIARDIKALDEKCVVVRLGIDVRDTPFIDQYLGAV